jgi:hypothetical protein
MREADRHETPFILGVLVLAAVIIVLPAGRIE